MDPVLGIIVNTALTVTCSRLMWWAINRFKEVLKKYDGWRDIKEMQTYLFGLHEDKCAILTGENRWPSVNDPRVCFGEEYEAGSPLPPYDIKGMKLLIDNLHKRHGTLLDFWRPEDNIQIKRVPGSLILLGGTRVLKTGTDALEPFKTVLPFRFIDRNEVPKEKLCPWHTREKDEHDSDDINRVFSDEKTGAKYQKDSKTDRYLIDTIDQDRSPFGPSVSPEGRIERDVVRLTIVPNSVPNFQAKKLIIINPGYGAGSCIDEIFNNGNILQRLCSVARDSTTPWLQAVFTVSVRHTDESEEYKDLELIEDAIMPLPRG